MTGGKATKHIVETIAKVIFLICAAVAIVAVLSITVYMFAKGTPALAKVGVIDLLFGTVWQPTAATPSYGILYIILTSIVGTAVAILINSVCNIWTAWTYGFKSIDVPPGKTGVCGKYNPSVYRWFQSAFCDYCTGNHDFAYGNQYQCFLHPSSTRTFKICFACPRSNTYPDDI